MLLRSFLIAYVLMSPGIALATDAAPPSGDGPTTPPQATNPAPNGQTGTDHSAATQEPYTPPFPEHEELFQPPSNARPAVQRQDNTEVALKGFVNLGGERVVLTINGRVKQLAVGESTGGVEVIRINPPKVTLQRGRTRWTDTLFEVRAARIAPPVSEDGDKPAATASVENAPAPDAPSQEAPTPQAEPTVDAVETPPSDSGAPEPAVGQGSP